MLTKEFKYDDIITRYNGTLFKHGEVHYGEVKRDERGYNSRPVKVNFELDVTDFNLISFKSNLEKFIQKYSQ